CAGPHSRSLDFPSTPDTGPARGASARLHCRAGPLRWPRPSGPCRARTGLTSLSHVALSGVGAGAAASPRPVSEGWWARGGVGVRGPRGGWGVTPRSGAPRTPDPSSVAPVPPAVRTPPLRGVPSLITQSWYAWSAPGKGSLASTATASSSDWDETTVTCPP